MNNYIDEIIKETEKSYDNLDIPIGAIVVKNGVIIGRGHNERVEVPDVTNHAEIMAIREAEKYINDWRLNGCDLYVTLYPCDMCIEIIKAARVDNVYYLLEKDNKEIRNAIELTKSKILNLAIHGKLVPQDPNDEPAIDLLRRINPSFVPCDNAHDTNQLPKSWCWVRGSDLFEPMKSTQPDGETFKYIDIDAIDNKRNIITFIKTIETKFAPSRASRYTEKGDVLFSMVRPYLRNIAMIPEDNCIASTGFYVCRTKGYLNNHYCLYLMLSDYVVNGLNVFMKGDNSPSITKGQIDSFAFPIPPYNEQFRIVSMINEVFALLDEIK